MILARSLICRTAGVALAVLCVLPALRAQEALPSPATALHRLKDGNARFVADKPAKKDLGAKRRAELAKGQRPFAVVLTCSDSRVAPELIFDQGLGDLFVLRVAGNVTDPVVLGSIEYAVDHLKTPLVVVLGHEKCGAVAAAVEGGHPEGNLGKLIRHVHVGDNKGDAEAAVRTNVMYQAGQLTRESTVLKDFVSSKRVRLAAGVYSLKTGEVRWLDLAEKGNGKSAK